MDAPQEPSQTHERARYPLAQMPKEPLPALVLSSGRQGMWLLKWSMLLPLLAGAFWLISINSDSSNGWEIAACVMLALAPSPILLAIMFLIWSKIQARNLADLIDGHYWIHWTYEGEQWQQVIEDSRRSRGWFLPTMVLVLATVGLVTGIAISFSSKSESGGGLLVILLATAIGAAAGTVIGIVERCLVSMTEKIRRTEPARGVVAPKGIYLTGLFFAGKELGQKVLGVSIPEPKHDRLVFRVQVKGGRGYCIQRLELPIPPGQEDTARELVADFKNLAKD